MTLTFPYVVIKLGLYKLTQTIRVGTLSTTFSTPSLKSDLVTADP